MTQPKPLDDQSRAEQRRRALDRMAMSYPVVLERQPDQRKTSPRDA